MKEHTYIFTFENGEQATYQSTLVNYKEPYRYSKWLWTLIIDDLPCTSYPCNNDNELAIHIGKATATAKQVEIQ